MIVNFRKIVIFYTLHDHSNRIIFRDCFEPELMWYFWREVPYFHTWKVYNSKLISIIEISRRGCISWGNTFSVKETIISNIVSKNVSSYFVQRKKFLGEINIFRQENIRSFKLDLRLVEGDALTKLTLRYSAKDLISGTL